MRRPLHPLRPLLLALACASLLSTPFAALADTPAAQPSSPSATGATQPAAKRCEPHGVPAALCTRCNPKLEPVFKAKGDWCQEHARPESQCVLCHPELAKKGVK